MKKKIKYINKVKQNFLKKIKNLNEPRLSIYKSNKYLYCQIIDDFRNHTIYNSSTFSKFLNTKKNKNVLFENFKIKLINYLNEKDIKKIIIESKYYAITGNIKILLLFLLKNNYI